MWYTNEKNPEWAYKEDKSSGQKHKTMTNWHGVMYSCSLLLHSFVKHTENERNGRSLALQSILMCAAYVYIVTKPTRCVIYCSIENPNWGKLQLSCSFVCRRFWNEIKCVVMWYASLMCACNVRLINIHAYAQTATHSNGHGLHSIMVSCAST